MAEPLSADVVVVGSGSGGAVVARRPVDAGVRVVLVEADGRTRTRPSTTRLGCP
jgi:choline dehydrogenase